MVADFENGINNEIHKQSTTAGGQTIHTLSTTTAKITEGPKSKRVRNEITSDSSGYDASLMFSLSYL